MKPKPIRTHKEILKWMDESIVEVNNIIKYDGIEFGSKRYHYWMGCAASLKGVKEYLLGNEE